MDELSLSPVGRDEAEDGAGFFFILPDRIAAHAHAHSDGSLAENAEKLQMKHPQLGTEIRWFLVAEIVTPGPDGAIGSQAKCGAAHAP